MATALQLAEVIVRVLHDLNGLNPAELFSVEELYFVSTQPRHIQSVQERLESHLWQ